MNILIVEDDRRIASFLSRGLAAEGYQVTVAEDGRDGLEHIRQGGFDLVILDRMLPYVNGLEVCRIVREERRPVLILMLTAKDGIQDKVEGLKGGADDYLTKPFAFDELLARLVALKRRRSSQEDPSVLVVGALSLDPASRRVVCEGRDVSLTVREFELLRYLMANAGKVVSRQRLLNSVWEYGFDPGTKIVDVYIRYLRKKLSDEGASIIQTVRGVGYMIPAG
ncbi:response regulator transcription factor [Chelatococcus sambhunathii]|uniref:Response regulator transcription factor n=1 Tax=Chelatococcus sambhunathii TaxID=363953 RepID=A0ABU1DKP4_9HYPH|nr:response regulator transcription factor [Chelatococcus sambhunathii]MDR4308646.1 response regulator transcription factor [Chelatococcus sambhunathii]